jgi:DNA-binding SARP family transcriptional activator
VVELYHRGSFFGAPAGTWVNPIRENLWRKYLTAAYSLTQDHIKHQEFDEAVDYCKRILKEDEFQEEAHQFGMIAYAGQGYRKGIEEQYRWYVRVFQDQYQLGPSNKTRLLYESLIR